MLTLSETLNNLGIDNDQLIVLGMLVGTDYNIRGIPKIGPKTALKLVKEYKNNFKELFKKVNWSEYFNYPWTEVFYQIKKIPVIDNYEISWKKPNKNKLWEILVGKHSFSEERVRNMLEKLTKNKKKMSQKSLGGWV